MKKGLFFLLCIVSLCAAQAQGTLQFNRVILLTSADGPQVVPAGKVWKVTYVNSSTARRVNTYASWGGESWSPTSPNPCTGATSGSSSSLFYYSFSNCPAGANGFEVNGQRVSFGGGNPLWLPATTNVLVTGTPCYNLVVGSVGANVPIRNNSDGIWECGPYSVGYTAVPNSPTVSIIEFNIIP